jgi:subfamily B ATP-binding cassette protein HlyB/CyaB
MPQNAEPDCQDGGLECLLALARLHGLRADADALRHAQGNSHECLSVNDILLAGKSVGLRLRSIRTRWKKLPRLPLPAIARRADGRFVLLAAARDDEVLVQDMQSRRPSTCSREQFEAVWSGELILATRRLDGVGLNGRFGFRWFLPALLKYRRLFGEVLVASFFLQLFALITPLFFQVIIDKVLVHNGMTTLHVLAIGLLAVAVFEVLLGGLRNYLFSHTTNRVDVVLGAKLFAHLLRLPMAYFDSRRVGDSVARVRELETIRDFLTGSTLTLVIDLLFTLVFFVVLFLYSPVLSAVVAGAVPLYLLLSAGITPVLRRRLEESFNRGAENQAFLVESISGMQTIKAMAVEPQMQRRWEEQLAGYIGTSFRTRNLGNIAGQLAGLINKLSVVLILWIGATLVMRGELTVGQLVAFNMIAGRISGPILRLVQLWQDFQQAGISVRRLGDIMNAPREAGHSAGRTSLPALRGAVRFERIGFRYANDRPRVLEDIDLEVQPGEVIGIVGRSGSGKSTLTRLLQRLHVPESGRVLVDGVDLALVEPAWLRRRIGVVLQENFLFNRSVRDNIALTDPGLSMDEIVRVAQLAGAHEFILELPEGYDTLVGEQGSNLSGGQRQRIAIARALVGDPAILIFDEATSALDYESEQIIQRNMQAICNGRTVFIIAHRLSAVRLADRILVIDRGRIVEQGGHDDLLRRQGAYARLFALQSGPHTVRTGEGGKSRQQPYPPAPFGPGYSTPLVDGQ